MPDDDTGHLCLNCLAARIAGEVLNEFSDAEPDVAMSYSAWMTLGMIIEDRLKTALGEETPDEPTLVQ
jgi:hypothetical protein